MSEPISATATTSLQSTPYTVKVASSQQSHTRSNIDTSLQRELQKNLSRIPLVNFLAAVEHEIPENDKSGYHSSLSDFLGGLNSDHEVQNALSEYGLGTDEEQLYEPFADLANRITSLFNTRFPFLVRRKIKFHGLGGTVIYGIPSYHCGQPIKGTGSSRRPDGLAILEGEPLAEGEPSDGWRRSVLAIEHKLSASTKDQQLLSRVPEQIYSAPASLAEGSAASQSQKQKRLRDSSGPERSGKRRREEIPPATLRVSRATTSEPSIATSSQSSKPKELTKDELQLASYAMETICALGNRTHAFGVLMDRFRTTLWYYDRSGAICSDSFPFDQELSSLAKFIIAFSTMSDERLGFNMELRPPRGVPSGSVAALAPQDLAGFTMHWNDATDEKAVTVTLNSILDNRFGFVGRGTVVYTANIVKIQEGRELEEEGRVEEDAVVKWSWQVKTRKPEWEWVHAAVTNGCPEELIVKVLGYHQSVLLTAGFRQRFGTVQHSIGFEDRELRVQVTERLRLVTELGVDDFMYAVWCYILTIEKLDKAGIRHRDISVGNLGWKHGIGGKVLPKIFDFDHAQSTDGAPASSRHITGTLPFMALDLLRNFNAPHLVRFDLESLVWCVVWITVCFSDGKDTTVGKKHPLKDWFTGDTQSIRKAKRVYLSEAVVPQEFYAKTKGGILHLLLAFLQGYTTQDTQTMKKDFSDANPFAGETPTLDETFDDVGCVIFRDNLRKKFRWISDDDDALRL